MKKHSKILAIVLVLAMMLTMSMGAFAAGSITVGIDNDSNIPATTTFTSSAYKIFGLTVNGSSYDYTLNPDFAGFAAWAKLQSSCPTGLTGTVTLADYLGLGSGTVAFDNTNMQAIAALLNNYIASNPDSVTFTKIDNLTNLAAGYYLVNSYVNSKNSANVDNGAISRSILVNVKDANVDVKFKNDVPTIEKEVFNSNTGINGWTDWADANMGPVEFKLTANVPDLTAHHYKAYQFIVKDTMCEALDYVAGSVKVFVNDDEVTDELDTLFTIATGNTTSTATKYVGGTDLTVTFDPDLFVDYVNAGPVEVVITYTATLNHKAVIGVGGNWNKVKLEYSRDPFDDGTGTPGETPEEEVPVYTFEFDIFKHADPEDAEPLALADAEFTFGKNADGTGLIEFVEVSAAELAELNITYPNGSNPTVYRPFITGKDSGTPITTLVTSDSGLIAIIGLDAGTYYLKETKAPENYNLITTPFKVEIINENSDGDYTVEIDDTLIDKETATGITLESFVLNVLNTSGIEFPGTGGIGRTIFILVGATMLGMGLISLVVFRKKIFGTK